MTNPELPEGFRIIRHTYGGSGRGDELFTIALQHWRTLTFRRWSPLLRRRVESRQQWVTVEIGNPFAYEGDNYRNLAATARMLAANSTRLDGDKG